MKKRTTQPEELEPEREAEFQEEEERADKRAMCSDSDYSPSSVSESGSDKG